jgi:hypothetical protein
MMMLLVCVVEVVMAMAMVGTATAAAAGLTGAAGSQAQVAGLLVLWLLGGCWRRYRGSAATIILGEKKIK